MNWYAYAGNNPVRHVDPEGLYYKYAHSDLATKGYNRSGLHNLIPRGSCGISSAAAAPDDWNSTLGRTPHYDDWITGQTRGEYADEMTGKAIKAYQSGDYAGGLDYLGYGSHAVADGYSHVGGAATRSGHLWMNVGAKIGKHGHPDDPATNWGAYSNASKAITGYFDSFVNTVSP